MLLWGRLALKHTSTHSLETHTAFKEPQLHSLDPRLCVSFTNPPKWRVLTSSPRPEVCLASVYFLWKEISGGYNKDFNCYSCEKSRNTHRLPWKSRSAGLSRKTVLSRESSRSDHTDVTHVSLRPVVTSDPGLAHRTFLVDWSHDRHVYQRIATHSCMYIRHEWDYRINNRVTIHQIKIKIMMWPWCILNQRIVEMHCTDYNRISTSYSHHF